MIPLIVTVLAVLAAALYLASAALLARSLLSATPAGAPAWLLAAAAIVLQGWTLALDLWRPQGVTLGVAQALSLFTWQCALLLSLFCLRKPLAHLGVFVYPMAAITCGLVLVPAEPGVALPPVWTIQLHILLSLLAYGLLTIAAVQAVVLAFQDRQLHRHELGGITRNLPPLQTMEQMLFELIAAGFFLLTLALLSGLVFVQHLLTQHLVHKTVLSFAAWTFFGILLWGRWRHGWRGRVAVRWTLGGYAVLVLAYFGSKFVLETLLGKHW